MAKINISCFPRNYNSVVVVNDTGDGNYSATTTNDPQQLYMLWLEYMIPIISFLGVLGNMLNLIVLTRQRILSSMDKLERSATFGLAALALSDMMFCISIFPHSFTLNEPPFYSIDGYRLFDLYYKLYGIALINLFMMTSTWLIVVMAVSRYIVVVHPMKARYTVTVKKTACAIVLTYICSAVLSLPHFLHLRITPCVGFPGHDMMRIYRIDNKLLARVLIRYIRWIWPVFADFIPLLILVLCNTRLCCELRKARVFRRSSCHHRNNQERHDRVTLTLVIIVLSLLVLVSPSEVLRFVNPYDLGEVGYYIVSITNVLQALNFAINFILYCVVNRHFRQAMCDIVCGCVSKFPNAHVTDLATSNGNTSQRQRSSPGRTNKLSMSTEETFL